MRACSHAAKDVVAVHLGRFGERDCVSVGGDGGAGPDEVKNGVEDAALPHVATPVPVKGRATPNVVLFQTRDDRVLPLAAGRAFGGNKTLSLRILLTHVDAVVQRNETFLRRSGESYQKLVGGVSRKTKLFERRFHVTLDRRHEHQIVLTVVPRFEKMVGHLFFEFARFQTQVDQIGRSFGAKEVWSIVQEILPCHERRCRRAIDPRNKNDRKDDGNIRCSVMDAC